MLGWNRGTRRAAVFVTTVWCFLLASARAWAQPYPGGGQTPPEVKGQQFFHGGQVPRTGADVLLFVLIALILVVIGIALHLANRRRAASRGD